MQALLESICFIVRLKTKLTSKTNEIKNLCFVFFLHLYLTYTEGGGGSGAHVLTLCMIMAVIALVYLQECSYSNELSPFLPDSTH